jgi:two-component system response regulator YesN
MKKRLEVVIVDDEVQITELLKTFLQCSSKHSNIHTFNDSIEARNFLSNNKVDILITDYKMPKCNGLQLMEHLDSNVKRFLFPVLSQKLLKSGSSS